MEKRGEKREINIGKKGRQIETEEGKRQIKKGVKDRDVKRERERERERPPHQDPLDKP